MIKGDSDCGGDSVNKIIRSAEGVELGCGGPESEDESRTRKLVNCA